MTVLSLMESVSGIHNNSRQCNILTHTVANSSMVVRQFLTSRLKNSVS